MITYLTNQREFWIKSIENQPLRVCFKIENRIVEKLKMIDNQWFIANSAPFRSDIL